MRQPCMFTPFFFLYVSKDARPRASPHFRATLSILVTKMFALGIAIFFFEEIHFNQNQSWEGTEWQLGAVRYRAFGSPFWSAKVQQAADVAMAILWEVSSPSRLGPDLCPEKSICLWIVLFCFWCPGFFSLYTPLLFQNFDSWYVKPKELHNLT